ncbi:MAG: hypothetical protein HYT40_00135 [Candidatus Sungbacteria bacterium]|uniref:Uncharacterized protein n=1 Tax=Candidatus Sungiibacteriota bacterium TaxID=2750080 RepID=A0A931SAR8_9BACT|nr:hypothetical protein [Candidatus Sungbacteria bacterium]
MSQEIPKKIYIGLIVILLAGNIFFFFQYLRVQRDAQKTIEAVKAQKAVNVKVRDFAELFIEKVLKAEAEIDFDTRLILENTVRDIGDDEILAKWREFVDSKTEPEAQQKVKSLLSLLVKKIKSVPNP